MNGSDPGVGAARPLIGLTTYLQPAQTGVWDVRAGLLPAGYFEGVGRAGGISVLLPPQPVDEGIAGRVLDGLDGLIITGGRDVDPATYGSTRHPATDEPGADSRVRDAFEIGLLQEALRRGTPVLGICRGAQVLNVALGGTLHQHLPDVLGHTRHQQGNAVFTTSSITAVSGTRVQSLVGQTTQAQCYHHQAIDRLGEGLIVSASDADGVVEAVEIDPVRHPHSWVVAVQWHPEERLDDLRLFAGLVGAARRYATEKIQKVSP
ncbi:gamma-glutamyl-gamma-aminobutyrate hydrolase [Mycolicibacterium cyprinidarum]|uniref:Gamma-glutamyl-gamma-aminobutyrate hydrolase n=1 Tax=Mycolicibacterium cyprinidarum TaxID=2860311 RepID=A0ABQ4V7G1_9MYCO|nr:gamma-glutamyl-gamma-aminobutyrate hydrolase [Mycolicibacterium sp. NGTWSNA01]